ncbi:methyltransferase domain-containing protein [Apiospora marii]|uniref:Methyltransferase domain-containing protein n=1 Tax=Apiospora marii TaxID=335849 RepID=A0ABR1S953_9PEZI
MDPAALFDSPREVTNSSISDPASQVGVGGRTYQAYREDTYYLPNDADEQDRLDFQHEMTSILLDKQLSVAPVQDPKYVLDVATGTGIWALDYATENPDCQVIGTDLSLIQPDMEATVPNCRFVREDSEDPWTYANRITYAVNPGGWIEYVDQSVEPMRHGGTAEGSVWHHYVTTFLDTMAKLGRDLQCPRKYKQWLEEVGFVNVQEQLVPIPMSPWPSNPKLKLAGSYNLAKVRTGDLQVAKPIFLRNGMSDLEYEELANKVRLEITDRNNQYYILLVVVYGQKPPAG